MFLHSMSLDCMITRSFTPKRVRTRNLQSIRTIIYLGKMYGPILDRIPVCFVALFPDGQPKSFEMGENSRSLQKLTSLKSSDRFKMNQM